MEFIFATNNLHKLDEIRAKLNGESFTVLSLKDMHFHEEIPEDHDTLEGNANQKAKYIHARFGMNCFADDTGLEIEALNGEPGVYSARYAELTSEVKPNEEISVANVRKVLQKLDGEKNRRAKFRTIITLILRDNIYNFEGEVKGRIINDKRGNLGFGYDPIFIPDGFDKTFAELPIDVKNKISHRGKAVEKLVQFLNTQIK